MRIALRSLIATAALGLALAPAAFADSATEDLYLARDACGGTAAPNTHLAFDLGATTLGCGSVVAATPSTTSYPATQGLPVTVQAADANGAREVYVAISLGSFTGNPLGGIGDEEVDVDLTGKLGTQTVSLGSGQIITPAADMLRKGAYLAEFHFPLKTAQGGVYKTLNLDLTVGGSLLSGYVDTNGSSVVSLPVADPPADEG